jgi:hypothetical protein
MNEINCLTCQNYVKKQYYLMTEGILCKEFNDWISKESIYDECTFYKSNETL